MGNPAPGCVELHIVIPGLGMNGPAKKRGMIQADRVDAAPGHASPFRAPSVQVIPGHHSGFPLLKNVWRHFAIQNFRCASDSQFHFSFQPPCAWRTQARDVIPAHLCYQRLVPGGALWVESHSDMFATWSWAWRSGKNGKLFEDTPARSFCRFLIQRDTRLFDLTLKTIVLRRQNDGSYHLFVIDLKSRVDNSETIPVSTYFRYFANIKMARRTRQRMERISVYRNMRRTLQ
jgi:hypothetical protein